jgi:glycosyltransferase involved in cell wall biosynthesis
MPVSASAPIVSVVLPTYNRAGFLPDAIQSVLDQSFEKWELLVVDDGSTDETSIVVQGFRDPRLRYLYQENAGVGAARNNGIAEARGEFVAFLDSDDFWLPQKLGRQVEVLVQNPQAGLVGGGCVFVDEAKQPIGRPSICPERISGEAFEIYTALPGSGSNAMIRRSVCEVVGVFDPSLRRAQDREYWLRISRAFEVHGVPEPTVAIRIHSTTRPGINFGVIRECRERINSAIESPRSRRKADAWMYYYFFTLLVQERRWMRAIGYLFLSAWVHPGTIGYGRTRWKNAIGILLPRWITQKLSRVSSPLKGCMTLIGWLATGFRDSGHSASTSNNGTRNDWCD